MATADLAAVGRSAGYVFFAGGEAMEAYNWRTGGESSATFFTNSGVALTSLVVGGVPGGIMGGLYFGVEHTIGWSNVVGVSDCSYARGKGLPCP